MGLIFELIVWLERPVGSCPAVAPPGVEKITTGRGAGLWAWCHHYLFAIYFPLARGVSSLVE